MSAFVEGTAGPAGVGRPAAPVSAAGDRPLPTASPVPTTRIERPARLAETVVTDVIGWVVGGVSPPGSVLPPEPELAATFGVSRTVVREAVKELAAKGLVRVRQGKGTTVLDMAHWNLLDDAVLAAVLAHREGLAVLADLVRVRIALESELVAAATERVTAEQLTELAGLMAELTGARDTPTRYGELENRFHRRLVEISQNLVGATILSGIWRQLHLGEGRWADQVRESAPLAEAHAQHMDILREVTRRDPAAAATAVRNHITTSWSWVFQALEAHQAES